jgi:hypothetical protein
MDTVIHNNTLTEAAIEYVRRFDEVGDKEPRFDIHFEGFGTGGTAGVTKEFAIRYLRDLAASDDPHYRYRTRIRSLAVKVRYPEFTLC